MCSSFVLSLLRLHDRLEVHKTIIIYSLRILRIGCHTDAHTYTESTAQWYRKTKDVERLKGAFNAHKFTCVDVSRIRLRTSFRWERSAIILLLLLVMSSVSAVGTQHAIPCFSSLGTHLLVGLRRRACICSSHWRRFTTNVCIGLLTVIRRLHTMPHFIPNWRQRQRKMFASECAACLVRPTDHCYRRRAHTPTHRRMQERAKRMPFTWNRNHKSLLFSSN